MKYLLTLLACACLLLSCHKSNKSHVLTGKWKCVESLHIGQTTWTPVSLSDQATITFNSNYTYLNTPPPVSSMSACGGKYRITNSNTLFMTNDCSQTPDFEIEYGFTVSNNTLILDHRMSATGYQTKYIRQ